MARYSSVKCLELAFFWKEHLKAWCDSDLNQREYCERHGLALKRFENWRAKFKDKETIVPEGLLWRRGGGDRPRLKPRRREIHFTPVRKRRNYSDADKRRIIEEASCENASISGVARKYGISTSLMFQWRKLLGTGLCLFTKRLEHGAFEWRVKGTTGQTVSLTSAQLSMLIEGIDWRVPDRRWKPAVAG